MTWAPDVGDIVDVVFNWTGPAQLAQTHLGLKATGAAQTIENLAATMVTNVLKSSSGGLTWGHSSAWAIGSITFNDVKPGTRAPYIHTFSAVAGSDITGDDLPPQSSLVVTWRTTLKGRSYRGRTYLPGWKESQQASGTWAANATTAASDWADEMMRLYDGGAVNPNYQLSVVSRYLNGVKRLTPVATAIVSRSTRSVVYTQRRRTIGVGI